MPYSIGRSKLECGPPSIQRRKVWLTPATRLPCRWRSVLYFSERPICNGWD